MMGFGEEGKNFPEKFFSSSPISNQPLLGIELLQKTLTAIDIEDRTGHGTVEEQHTDCFCQV